MLVGDQQRQLQQAYRAASGDVVMVACVATDTIQWIFDQLDDADTLVIAAAAGEYGVWSIPFAGAASDGAGMAGEPVLGGHTTLRTTVGELMHRQESQQRPLAAAGP